MREAIVKQTDFSMHIANYFGAEQSTAGANFVFSPLSIHIVLSLIASGSKGKTLDQITAFLRSQSPSIQHLADLASQIIDVVLVDGSSSAAPRLSFANGVWFDHSFPINPSFKQIAVGSYRAQTQDVDFQTKAVQVINEVNSWVDKETVGLIKELLPPGSVDHSTRLLLGNVLYFKGIWEEKFNASETKDHEFHLLDGKSIAAPFMTSQKKQFVATYNGFKTLKLPYCQGDDRRQFSMYIFLPDAKDGVFDLSKRLAEPRFMDRHLPLVKVLIGEFKIPKFKFSFDIEASKVLKEMGLVLPFGTEADLTGMMDDFSNKIPLCVSAIFHKSFVEVNEEGTEAAAATVASIVFKGVSEPPCDFVADHPFVFLIREELTGVVIFTGHVVNPLLN